MDEAYRMTEQEILRIEQRLAREYKRAEAQIQVKVDDYFRRFLKKDEQWREWVAKGIKTQAEYKQWRLGQIIVGKRWQDLRHQVAVDYAHVNEAARQIVSGEVPKVYAENFNYITYSIEHDTMLDTGFTLYNRDAVARIVRDNPKMIPDPGRRVQQRILEGKDIRYNEQRVQSVVIQGIMQGESIPKIAKRFEDEVGESNHKSAIRNARTAMTAAQNAGRMDSMHRAQELGIQTEKTWVAVWDNRTRHAHRELDGVTVPLEEEFENSIGLIEYPGDPNADGANVYNCRCSLIQQIKGFEIDTTAYRSDADLGDMTYDEWKEAKAVSNPITRQEEIGEAIRWAWIGKYKHG